MMMLLCRYRLWGITVAPRMPMALYRAPGSVMMRGWGINPLPTSFQSGLASASSYTNALRMDCVGSMQMQRLAACFAGSICGHGLLANEGSVRQHGEFVCHPDLTRIQAFLVLWLAQSLDQLSAALQDSCTVTTEASFTP